jgi:small-conductance mechanosensitive channel
MKRFFYVFFTACILAVSLSSFADESKADWLQAAHTTIKNIKLELAAAHDKPGELSDRLAESNEPLADISNQAQQCIQESSDTLKTLQANLETMGTTGKSSDSSVSKAQQNLNESIDEASAQLASCQALLLETTTLSQKIKELKAEQLRNYLFGRSQPVWTAVDHLLMNPLSMNEKTAEYIEARIHLHKLPFTAWAVIFAATALGWLLGIPAERLFQRLAQSVQGKETTYRFYQSLCACLAKRVKPLLTLLAAGIASWFATETQPEAIPLFVVLIISLVMYQIASMLTRTLLDPCPPAHYFLKLDQKFAVKLNRRLRTLWLLSFLVIFLFASGLHGAIEGDQWTMIRAALVTVLVLNLVWLGLFMTKVPGLRIKGTIRAVTVLILLVALMAELLGYTNFSFYLLKALLGSVVLAIALWLGSVFIDEFFDGMDEGQRSWQKRLRVALGLKANERIPGLIWLRILSILSLWFFFGVGLMEFWGYSDTTWIWVKDILNNGFEIGAIRIVPLQVAIGLAVFGLFLTGMRWINTEVIPNWVKQTRLDHGGQDAVVTLTGYIGVMVAALIGISMAGFNLQNLAIVAGALSVGIGFGLQNIVNNFVSGIILLFERPIRTGDWIVAGDVQGFVRRISIRATLIETFDRADVIVPNSELISNTVTNWMLRDPWGRVHVPVGVAYGSDVDKVTEVLLEAGREHPLVMTDGKDVNPPVVLFMGFGDSSLNFELRCFIRQVDQRLTTLSDLNYAIEKKFREAGIEIPFPQRDIHVRSVSPGTGLRPDEPRSSDEPDIENR